MAWRPPAIAIGWPLCPARATIAANSSTLTGCSMRATRVRLSCECTSFTSVVDAASGMAEA